MIVALNRARGEDRREPGAVRQCGRGTAAQVRHAAGESDSISDGFSQDPVSLAPLRIHARTGSSGLFAPFCPLAFLLSPDQSEGWLVGAVGIENNADRNFKDLEEMLGSAKELKRNNRECKGILIGPLMAPRFSRPPRFRHSVFHSLSKSCSRLRAQNFAARMASRRNFTNVPDPNS